MVFFSSDYVFDGEQGRIDWKKRRRRSTYTATTSSKPKRSSQRRLRIYAIIRSCNMYGYRPGGKNFVMALIEHGRSRKPMRIPSDQWGSPTLCRRLGRSDCAARGDARVGRIFIVAGPDYVDRLTWALRVADAFGFDTGFLEPVATSELKQAARRPLRAGLESSESERRVGMHFRGLAAGLGRVLESMLV